MAQQSLSALPLAPPSRQTCCSHSGELFLLLRCGQSPADTQPARCHDLPKKQLRSEPGGNVRRPLPLCAVSRLRSPAGRRGRRGHPVTLHRQHSEGPQVGLDSGAVLGQAVKHPVCWESLLVTLIRLEGSVRSSLGGDVTRAATLHHHFIIDSPR